MTTTRDEIYELLESLPDENLEDVRNFVMVLLSEPDNLTEDEWQEVRKGEEEVRQGKWVTWEDIKRTDV